MAKIYFLRVNEISLNGYKTRHWYSVNDDDYLTHLRVCLEICEISRLKMYCNATKFLIQSGTHCDPTQFSTLNGHAVI